MKLECFQVVRFTEEDRAEINAIAARLGLTRSEITRRSLRIALPILRDLNLPGSPRRVKSESVVQK